MDLKTAKLTFQRPVITEKYAFDLIQNVLHEFNSKINAFYIAYPWATLLDNYNIKLIKNTNLPFRQYLSAYIDFEPINSNLSFSVCQTYGFKKLLPFFQELGINLVFCPHAVKNEVEEIKENYGIKLSPFPLYPVNTGNSDKASMYHYSFIGYINYQGGEEKSRIRATELRNKLVYNIKHPIDTLVMPIESWHFDSIVYKQDIHGKNLNAVEKTRYRIRTERYKDVMSKSRFALCPRGMGPASIRFWEALGSGTIPVNISDDFWLPGEEYFDWDSCVVTVKEKDVLHIPDILNEISEEREHEMRKNALKAFKMFTGENFISPIKYKLLGVVPDVD